VRGILGNTVAKKHLAARKSSSLASQQWLSENEDGTPRLLICSLTSACLQRCRLRLARLPAAAGNATMC
jgi:hypothetical protein